MIAPETLDPAIGDDSIGELGLMAPLDLPTEIALAPAEACALQDTLAAFLAALALADPARRAAAVTALAAACAVPKASPAPVETTGTPVKPPEVADFDGYFNVRRVAGPDRAALLLAGLLATASAVLSLAVRAPHLSQAALARQIAGFAAYARLLGRICDLEPLP